MTRSDGRMIAPTEDRELDEIRSKLERLGSVNTAPGWQRTVLSARVNSAAYEAVIRDWLYRLIIEHPSGNSKTDIEAQHESLTSFDANVRSLDIEGWDALRWAVFGGTFVTGVERVDDLIELAGPNDRMVIPVTDDSAYCYTGWVASAITDHLLDELDEQPSLTDVIYGARAMLVPMPQHRVDHYDDPFEQEPAGRGAPSAVAVHHSGDDLVDLPTIELARFIQRQDMEYMNPAMARLQFEWGSGGPFPIFPGLADSYAGFAIGTPIGWIMGEEPDGHAVSQMAGWLFTNESTGRPSEFTLLVAYAGEIEQR